MLIALVFRIGPDGCANACSRIRILTTTAMSLLLVTATSSSPGFQIISGGSTNVVLSSHVFTDGLMLIFQDLSHLGSSSNPWGSSNGSTTNTGGSTRHNTVSRSNPKCIFDGSTANKSIFIKSQMVLLVRKRNRPRGF